MGLTDESELDDDLLDAAFAGIFGFTKSAPLDVEAAGAWNRFLTIRDEEEDYNEFSFCKLHV